MVSWQFGSWQLAKYELAVGQLAVGKQIQKEAPHPPLPAEKSESQPLAVLSHRIKHSNLHRGTLLREEKGRG